MAFLPKQGDVLEISEDHEAVDEHHCRIGFWIFIRYYYINWAGIEILAKYLVGK